MVLMVSYLWIIKLQWGQLIFLMIFFNLMLLLVYLGEFVFSVFLVLLLSCLFYLFCLSLLSPCFMRLCNFVVLICLRWLLLVVCLLFVFCCCMLTFWYTWYVCLFGFVSPLICFAVFELYFIFVLFLFWCFHMLFFFIIFLWVNMWFAVLLFCLYEGLWVEGVILTGGYFC